ncbi:thioredoxin-disulfide reductase [Spirochaetota bacterium]
MKDLIIIGAGPAGLSASIYGIRAGLDLAVIEKYAPGGQVINTYEVENYPGFIDPLSGFELMSKMEGQAKRLGVEVLNGEAGSIDKDDNKNIFNVKLTDGQELQSRSVIIASGANHRKLMVPGEEEFTGRGVSYCATCDGAFYKEKVTAVVGGGDVALEEAIFLTRFASKVYIIHRRDEFRGAKILQKRVLDNEKIEPVYDSVLESIKGDQKVESLLLKNVKTEGESSIDVDGVFILIGFDPNTGYLGNDILNDNREVIVDMSMKTPTDGLFAAGDLRCKSKRQIVMACADGATAAISAYDYIQELG